MHIKFSKQHHHHANTQRAFFVVRSALYALTVLGVRSNALLSFLLLPIDFLFTGYSNIYYPLLEVRCTIRAIQWC